MMRMIPGTRAILLATGLAMATTTFAAAEEAVAPAEPAAAEAAPEKETQPFSPTIYFGPAFGYADQDSSEFGWAMHVLARPIRNLGIQLEYFNVGGQTNSSGEFDGFYVGLMPVLPINKGLSLFGQVGAAFSDAGDDVAGGGGILYEIPAAFLNNNKVDLLLRLDYKYLNLGDGAHLLTLGIMLGFHK